MNPFQVVRDFEAALCEYTGAPYAVAVNSCTNAILLCCHGLKVDYVTIPKRTYVGVAQSIRNAGGRVICENLDWGGQYQLKPYPIWDAARRFTSNMYRGGYQCVSFHVSKILGIDQGGAILHDDHVSDGYLRRARFDGRTEQVDPSLDKFTELAFHCYMSPGTAAEGLRRLAILPKDNEDLPNSDYPDLSLTDWNALR